MRSMAIPRRSHQTGSFERLTRELGLAKGAPLSERMALGKPRSTNSRWKGANADMRWCEFIARLGGAAVGTSLLWPLGRHVRVPSHVARPWRYNDSVRPSYSLWSRSKRRVAWHFILEMIISTRLAAQSFR